MSAPAAAPAAAPTYAASSSAAASVPAPSVSVEDASNLKQCSACKKDQPEDEFSGAQLKKKGKRVCKPCVAKRDEEAAEKASAAAAAASVHSFSARLAALPASSPLVTCPSCNKKQVRVVACVECDRKSSCCSTSCFVEHHNSGQCLAIQTMPPLSIADEDRLTVAEVELHWPRLVSRLRLLDLHKTLRSKDKEEDDLLATLGSMIEPRHVSSIVEVYPPQVAKPWWSKALASHPLHNNFSAYLSVLHTICEELNAVSQRVANAKMGILGAELASHGDMQPLLDIEHVPAVLDPSRLLHRLMVYWIYYVRHVNPLFLREGTAEYVDVSSDEDGLIPVDFETPKSGSRIFHGLAYSTVLDSRGVATLVPSTCDEPFPFSSNRYAATALVLPDSRRWLVTHAGRLVHEAGLHVELRAGGQHPVVVHALTGRGHDPHTSFTSAPAHMEYMEPAGLRAFKEKYLSIRRKPTNKEEPDEITEDIDDELLARQQPGYFHIVPAMKAILGPDWPTEPNQQLFVAIPRARIEAEVTELLLLETLVEEAAAGDEHARLMIQHIEEECGAPIADVIQAQRSKLEIMLEDQRKQLLIHAEAVERLENRNRLLKGGSSVICNSSASAASAVAASSTAALVTSSSSSALHPPSYSWTQQKEFKSVESLRAPGRKKYGTIMKAALRFLHSLKPKSINKSGGSHTVFHFHSGAPVTLVTPHAGGSKDSTKSSSYCTRLYATLHEAALQRFTPASDSATSAGPARLK